MDSDIRGRADVGELWSAIAALSGAVASAAAIAAWWTPYRRTLAVDREATVHAARRAEARAASVIVSARWTSDTAIDVRITNGGSTAITDVEVMDVRRHPGHPGDRWQLAPASEPNAQTVCLLQPRESLAAKVQLIDASGAPVSQAPDIVLVVVFRFLDADGRWWRREMGRPPHQCEVQPFA